MLDSHLLATVAAVIREGSFERAATMLHITPSAVSQRIRQIEEQIGAILIVRGQPCTATDTGMQLYRHAEAVSLLEHELRGRLPNAFAQDDASAKTRLRVVVNADSLATWFIEALASFARDADVLVDVATDDQDQTEEWLRRGHAIAAVTSQSRAVQGFRSRKLGELRYVAVASPAFIAKWFAGGVTAESLQPAPSLVFSNYDRLQERWVRRLLRRDVSLPAHRLPSPAAFVEATERGMGWGMNPQALISERLRDGRLVELVTLRPLDVPLYWLWSAMKAPIIETLTAHVLKTASQALNPTQTS